MSVDAHELLKLPTVREAILHEKLREDKVRCLTCEHKCIVPLGGTGFCGTRMNVEGKLYTLIYGDLSAIESRPQEIKPFFHFWPGAYALTYSSYSCSFRCPWCQNWHLSKMRPDVKSAKFTPPERIVRMALRRGDQGICVSFNEPTLLHEFNLEAFSLAKREGILFNEYVSNGYMTEQALRQLIEAGMGGLKIDIKGDQEAVRKYCGADVNVCWRNARLARGMGVHVEIVCLIIPGINDSEWILMSIVDRHLKEVGQLIPIHFTRYYPAYTFSAPPTPIRTLERAREMAIREGIAYAYIGNVPGHPYENTYCHDCGEILIKRYGVQVVEFRLEEGNRCPKCKVEVPVVGRYSHRAYRRFMWL